MWKRNSRSSFFVALAVLGLTVIFAARSAHAATLNYTFELGGNGFAQTYYDPTNINNSRIYLGSGSGTVVYDTVSQTLTMNLDTTGFVYGASIINGVQDVDRSKIILSNVDASATMTYTNVTQESDPNGLFGLAAKNSTSSGTISIADIGLGGLTPVTFSAMGMMMDFSDPGLVSTHREYTDIQDLGAANYFQYVSTDPLSAFFNQTVFFSWMVSNGPVIVNGINYGIVHADGLGSNIPEPASMLLLGSALLGGLAARRKHG